MELMEIILLIAGGIIFILSFFIPDREASSGRQGGGAENARALAEEEVKTLVSREVDSIREHVDDVVEEAVSYAMEKTERSLERLSNEKIMAVSEYSDTVLAEIHKNHEEAMFLYDMLNNKHINLKNAVSEVNRTVKEAEEAVLSFQKLAPETVSAAEEKILERPPESTIKPEPVKPKPEKSGLERLRGASEPSPEAVPAAVPVSPVLPTAAAAIQGATPEIYTAGNPEKEDSRQGEEEQGRNSNDRILELFQEGKPVVDIARELELGVGEVNLVINLFKNQ